MTPGERIEAVTALGFADRQASFLVTVALHSGYCLRRQYEAFAGIRYGKNVRGFLDRLVTSGLATRFAGRADRGHLYHVHARAFYRAIGEYGCRNRRAASAPQIARKLMVLDAVIARSTAMWLATETEKIEYFTQRLGIPREVLPQRRGDGTNLRHFMHQLPIFIADGSATPHFLYLATDGSPDAFTSFLHGHARLLRCLATWTIVLVGIRCWPALPNVFDRFATSLTSTLSAAADELRWYFERRQLIDRGDLAQVSVGTCAATATCGSGSTHRRTRRCTRSG